MGNESKTPKAFNIIRPPAYHANSHTSQTSFTPSTSTSQRSQVSLQKSRKPRILTSAQIDVTSEDPPPSRKYRVSQVTQGHLSSSSSSQSKKPTLFSPSSFTSSNGSHFSSYSVSPPTYQKPHENGSIAILRDHAASSNSFSLSPSSSISNSRQPGKSQSAHSAIYSKSYSDDGIGSNSISSDIYPEGSTLGSSSGPLKMYATEHENDGGSQINESDGATRVVAKVKGGTIINSRGKVLNKTMYEAEQEARTNRKILDLEISNKSLLQLNQQLEARLQEQEKELLMIKKRSSTEHSTSPFSETSPDIARDLDEDVREIIDEDPIFSKICSIVEQLIKDAKEGLAVKSNFSNRVLRSSDLPIDPAETDILKSIADMVDEEEEAEFLAEEEAQRNQVATF